MLNFLLVFLSWFLLLLGFISLVTPIPGATLLIAAGLTLLIYASPKARLCIQWFRSRLPWFHKFFSWLEDKVGIRISIVGETLKDTRPLTHTIGKDLSHKQYVQEKLAEEQKARRL